MWKILGYESFFVLTVLQIFPCLPGRVCHKGVCYGGMDDVDSGGDVHTYYVRPEGSVSSQCDGSFCINALVSGTRFNCGDNVSSLLKTYEPWRLPSNIRLLPSCEGKQILRRLRGPSEDVGSITYTDIAAAVLNDGFTPCAIVNIGGSNISMEGFSLDNTDCYRGWPPMWKDTYLTSSIVVYPRSRVVRGVTLSDLSFELCEEDSVSVHIAGASNAFLVSEIYNLTLNNVADGKIMLDMVCGDTSVWNASHRLVIAPPYVSHCGQVVHTDNHSVAQYRFIGPRGVKWIMQAQTGQDGCNTNPSTIAAVVMGVMLVVSLLSTCLILLSSKTSVESNIERDLYKAD